MATRPRGYGLTAEVKGKVLSSLCVSRGCNKRCIYCGPATPVQVKVICLTSAKFFCGQNVSFCPITLYSSHDNPVSNKQILRCDGNSVPISFMPMAHKYLNRILSIPQLSLYTKRLLAYGCCWWPWLQALISARYKGLYPHHFSGQWCLPC